MIRLLVLASAVLFFQAEFVQGDLIGHWKADGNFSDSSGNNNNGLGLGNTGFVAGVHGQAFDFDGAGDYVRVEHDSIFDFGTGDFSVSFLVNFDSIPSNGGGLVDKDSHADPSSSQFEGWLFNSFDGGGGVGWETRDRPGVQTQNRHARSNFTTNTWFNLTATREANTLRLYVDGILQTTTAEASPTNVNSSVAMTIGALAGTGASGKTQFFDGQIDDLGIFNHALNQSEVSSIFNGGVSAVPEPSGLVFCGGLSCVALSRRRRVS